MIKKVTVREFERFLDEADSTTTTEFLTIGTYDVVAWKDDKAYWCNIQSLEGDSAIGTIEEISEEKAHELAVSGLEW